ncbi:chain length determinant protein EpsF [Pseudoduganella lutea]|uniref:Chain length determinant protein EpsF n=1 Tax=Pseudoduganella lutea TaxID=321985 RepID=A0A4P6KUC4_9BURK|nr:chain length determinant protein EpsF [Pseudoduganella lutea]QBE62530.1 chain length determinant protein EpsF [Pseudoduganella lutea]
MNFHQFFLILLARRWILITTLVLTAGATFVVSLLLPKTYQGTASVLMNYKGVDPVTGLSLPSQLLPGYMATQIDIIGSKNVALRVVEKLKLAESPAVIAQFNEAAKGQGNVRDWLSDLLLAKLEVVPSRESSVVNISFSGSDPQFVAAIANAFAEEYQNATVQLKVDPMKKATGYFDEQTRQLRDRLEVAQSRLSKYQQEHGIVSVDNRLDVETQRLNDLSVQLVAAQAQTMEAVSRRTMAQGAAGDAPDVANSPIVQNLRMSLATAESKLAELRQRLGTNHPQYLSARAEAERLRAELAAQTRSTSKSVGNNAGILAQREAALKQALDEQKTKLLQINRTRDEMNVLQKDVESAQRAYDVTSQRLAQTRIEGQSEQSDVALLNPAVAPIKPSGPKVLLNTVLALFLGTLLGTGLTLLAEMLDRRVRSEADLTDMLQIPVLGSIEWKGASQRRLGPAKFFTQRKLRLN